MKLLKELLTEDQLETLTIPLVEKLDESFQAAVERRTKEKVGLSVKSALKRLDEKHSAQLDSVLKFIDKDHSRKLQKAFKLLDEKYTRKLSTVSKSYKNIINEQSKNFKNELVNKIGNYIDLYLEQAVPTQELTEAIKNIKGRKLLEQVKKLVSIDESFIDNRQKKVLGKAARSIRDLQAEQRKLIKENQLLKESSQRTSRQLLLETKLSGLDRKKSKYIKDMLRGKDADYIENNFEYISEMYDKENDYRDTLLREDVMDKAISKRRSFFKDYEPQQLIAEKFKERFNENVEEEPADIMDNYVSAMASLDKK